VGRLYCYLHQSYNLQVEPRDRVLACNTQSYSYCGYTSSEISNEKFLVEQTDTLR
jgi:hypothetical protein